MAIIGKPANNTCWQGWEGREASCTGGGSEFGVVTGETIWRLLRKLKTELLCNPTIPLLGGGGVQSLSRVRLFATPRTAAARPPCPSPSPGACSDSVHRVGDAIQPSHPLSSPSPPAPNPSQHQGLFQRIGFFSTPEYVPGEKKNNTLIWKDTCTPEFIAALFTVAKIRKQPAVVASFNPLNHAGVGTPVTCFLQMKTQAPRG